VSKDWAFAATGPNGDPKISADRINTDMAAKEAARAIALSYLFFIDNPDFSNAVMVCGPCL